MKTGIVFLVIGLFCGNAWPAGAGYLVAVGAVLCTAAAWYVDHSPDEIFDFIEDLTEKFTVYVFLPWAVGALIGALWPVLA